MGVVPIGEGISHKPECIRFEGAKGTLLRVLASVVWWNRLGGEGEESEAVAIQGLRKALGTDTG